MAFPDTADTFTRKQDKPGTVVGSDLTIYYAEDINVLQAAVEVIEAKLVGESATAQVLVNAATIAVTSAQSTYRVNPAGNVTGIIVSVGTAPGQQVTIINESAFSVTMDVVGTSHVADGVSTVIAANRAARLSWDAATSKWYRV